MDPSASDPIRQRHIDALARRAAQHQGTARRLLDARLLHLQSAVPNGAVPNAQRAAASPASQRHAAFTDLLAHIAKHQGPAGELKAVRDYGGTWARLAVERRLTQTLARVPDNAGPLNTQRLLHQALTVMRSTSPAFLQHFMQYAECLLALEPLAAAPVGVKRAAERKVRGR
jgi:hypothetical protein